MTGRKAWNQMRKTSRPPRHSAWIWFTREMLESEAWAAMPLAARLVVERIAIEHLAHGGGENGRLIVTYDDFEKFGVRRKSIVQAIAVAVSLGWIDVVRGRRNSGPIRHPSRYRLTWLATTEDLAPTNRWKTIETREQALAAVSRAKTKCSRSRIAIERQAA